MSNWQSHPSRVCGLKSGNLGHSSIISPLSEIWFQGAHPLSSNKPVSGSVYTIPVPENPEKPSVSASVENPRISRPVCQNNGGNALSQSLPRALKSRQFSLCSLLHPAPEKAAGMRMGDSFFPGGFFKNRVRKKLISLFMTPLPLVCTFQGIGS